MRHEWQAEEMNKGTDTWRKRDLSLSRPRCQSEDNITPEQIHWEGVG